MYRFPTETRIPPGPPGLLNGSVPPADRRGKYLRQENLQAASKVLAPSPSPPHLKESNQKVAGSRSHARSDTATGEG
ncbi:hypothetical protein CSPX01_05356 [Colletotrichum filicis]|nr:hypothetical protein CSPX01_05356 [Colletotrichum filicis]